MKRWNCKKPKAAIDYEPSPFTSSELANFPLDAEQAMSDLAQGKAHVVVTETDSYELAASTDRQGITVALRCNGHGVCESHADRGAADDAEENERRRLRDAIEAIGAARGVI